EINAPRSVVNVRDKLKREWRSGVVCAALAIIIGLLLVAPRTSKPPLGLALIRLSYDLPFLLRPSISITNENVVLIYIDEISTETLKQKVEWERGIHTNLLRVLTAQRAQ